jgi:hypothetical protein
MIRTFLSFCAITLLLIGCRRQEQPQQPPTGVARQSVHDIEARAPSLSTQPSPRLIYRSTFPINDSREFGAAIDEGHQPWRLLPVDTAQFMIYPDSIPLILNPQIRDDLKKFYEQDPLITTVTPGSESLATWENQRIKAIVSLHVFKTPEGADLWQAHKLEVIKK